MMLFLITIAIVVTPYSKHTFVFRPFFNSPTIFSILNLKTNSSAITLGFVDHHWELSSKMGKTLPYNK